MKTYKLKCGFTLRVRHVPTLLIESEALRRYPEPAKPTYEHVVGEVGGEVITDTREKETPEWRNERRAWVRMYPLRERAVALDLAVQGFDIPEAVAEDLDAVAMPPDIDFGAKVNAILRMLRSTSGTVTDGKKKTLNELDSLYMFIRENDFTYEEVMAQARAMKSDD